MGELQALLNSLMGSPTAGCGCGCGPSGSNAHVQFDLKCVGSASGASATVERKYAYDLSATTADEDMLRLALHDIAAIKDIASQHPAKAIEIVQAVQQGNVDQAVRLAAEIGLTEGELQARGGGFLGLIVFVAAIVIVLVSASPISVESDKPPPNPPLIVPKPSLDEAERYLNNK